MEKIFQLIAEVGLPIAGALAMGAFIFIIIKYLKTIKDSTTVY